MTQPQPERPSLKPFDAGTDGDGQDRGQDATEAETPPGNLRRIGDAGSGGATEAAAEAIERATAAVGQSKDDERS